MSAPMTPPGPGYSMPQDVRLSANGKIFYVADMAANGIWLDRCAAVPGDPLHPHRRTRLLVSRNGKSLYIANRGQGSISVLDFATNNWSANGGSLVVAHRTWAASLRRQGDVVEWPLQRGRVRDVRSNARLLAKIPVGAGPHGLCVFPQPGRYSLGHTGNFR